LQPLHQPPQQQQQAQQQLKSLLFDGDVLSEEAANVMSKVLRAHMRG